MDALIATGISTGMALLSKFSAVLLIPMIALIVIASVLIDSERYVLLPSKRNQNETRHKFLQAATVLSLIFCCLTDNSASLLLSRISTLAIRLLSISDFVARRPTGLFLRRIFFAQLVELFPDRLSYQDTHG